MAGERGLDIAVALSETLVVLKDGDDRKQKNNSIQVYGKGERTLKVLGKENPFCISPISLFKKNNTGDIYNE